MTAAEDRSAGFGRQLRAQSRTEWKRVVRNRRYLFFTLLFPVGFFILFTHTFAQPGDGETLSGLGAGAYILVSMTAFGVMGGSLNLFGTRVATERGQGWVKLLRTTPLADSVYLLAKWLVGLLVAALIVVIMTAVGVWQGIHLAVSQWITFAFITWIGSFTFGSLGMAIGYWTDAESSQIVTQIVYFFLSMFGGLWWPIEILPKAMQTLAKFLPSYHYAYLARAAMTTGVEATPFLVLAAYTAAFLLVARWGWRRDEGTVYS